MDSFNASFRGNCLYPAEARERRKERKKEEKKNMDSSSIVSFLSSHFFPWPSLSLHTDKILLNIGQHWSKICRLTRPVQKELYDYYIFILVIVLQVSTVSLGPKKHIANGVSRREYPLSSCAQSDMASLLLIQPQMRNCRSSGFLQYSIINRKYNTIC